MTPEDPKRLLAELESARLALQARAKPPRRPGLILGAIMLLLIGGVILVLLIKMAGTLSQKPTPREPLPPSEPLPAAQHDAAQSFRRDQKNTVAMWTDGLPTPNLLPVSLPRMESCHTPVACAGFSGNG